MNFDRGKHEQSAPKARNIRRSCNRELYRTMKKLKLWIPPEQMIESEQYYYQRVVENLPWIVENGSNRKALADWWETEIAPKVGELWNVETDTLSQAFRDSFGG